MHEKCRETLVASRDRKKEKEKMWSKYYQAHRTAFTQTSGEFSIALNASLDIVLETNQKESPNQVDRRQRLNAAQDGALKQRGLLPMIIIVHGSGHGLKPTTIDRAMLSASRAALLLCLFAASSIASSVPLLDFLGTNPHTTSKTWSLTNDPVKNPPCTLEDILLSPNSDSLSRSVSFICGPLRR
jgi:hypothetical protein